MHEVIAGAGGHALEVLDVLQSASATLNLVFYDDVNTEQRTICELPVWRSIQGNADTAFNFYLGVGDPEARCQLFQKLTQSGGRYVPLRSPDVIVSGNIVSVQGDLMTKVFISSHACIHLGALINTGAQVHHEVNVEEFSTIGPGAILLGKSSVGKKSYIGAGAILMPGVKVGDKVMVGAGAVITKDIPDNVKVAGVPARLLK
jgi:sugar O-acyltransferase (sialic acid O-acetyltransferase NeuD family)